MNVWPLAEYNSLLHSSIHQSQELNCCVSMVSLCLLQKRHHCSISNDESSYFVPSFDWSANAIWNLISFCSLRPHIRRQVRLCEYISLLSSSTSWDNYLQYSKMQNLKWNWFDDSVDLLIPSSFLGFQVNYGIFMASWVWTSRQDYLLNQDSVSFEWDLLTKFSLFAVLKFRIKIMHMRLALGDRKEGLARLSYSCSLFLKHFAYFELCFFNLEFAWFVRNHDLIIYEMEVLAKYSHLATQGFYLPSQWIRQDRWKFYQAWSLGKVESET